ncbi:MAG: tetratricopeptide repeat protein [Alphaproteobacteria bacterium]|nr:tetratricopeptide repeat protein [Alphaproteobacteria bacterium]
MVSTEDHDETARRGLPWPEAYGALLPAIRAQWGVEGEIYLSRHLSGGKSGALVYVADIQSAGFTGQAILKLDHATDSAQQEAHEASLHGDAIKDAPAFAENHLPKLLNALHQGTQFAILSTIAGRGLEYAEPWTTCPFEQQLPAVRRMSRELLEDWNADYRLADGMHMPQQLLSGWLDYRLDPTEGRIHGFLQDDCGLAPDTATIVFEGQWYPNPMAFAYGAGDIPERLQLRTVTGHSHGDLHGLNLLVSPSASSEPNYHLIDLADYQSRRFLFFDHAYFELAYLLTVRSAAATANWETILARLSRFEHPEEGGLRADDLGVIEIVDALRGEVTAWIERHQADRLSYMESQVLLARVAAGLNFTHKRVSQEMRRMAFMYAATALKDYLKLNRVDWPKHGPSFSLQADDKATKAEPLEPSTFDEQSQHPAEKTAGANPAPTGSLLSELHRRRVITVAGLYGIAAWLCIEAVGALETRLGMPYWTDTAVIGLLLIGLPVACVVAWSAGRDSPSRQGGGRALRDLLVATCVLAILAVSLSRHVLDDFTSNTGLLQSAEERKSVAVLPFRNLSMNGDDDRFSDGLTMEIMGTLARSGEFRVPGQSSSFSYKNTSVDLREIGQALGVDYILEGSVRRNDDELRVEAQLVQADDGFLVWSDVFVDEISDIFVVQEKIANAIGGALKTPMGIEATTLQTSRTDVPEAYDLYLKGIALLQLRGPSVRHAADALVEAVTLDPNFAAGWAALSLVYEVYPTFVDSGVRTRLPATYYRLARDAALKAQALAPDAPIVQHALGNVNRRDGRWMAAEDHYRKALDAEPDNHSVMEDYSELLTVLGRHAQALDMAEQALELDPLNPLYVFRISQIGWLANQSINSVEAMIALFSKYPEFQVMTVRPIIGYMFSTGQVERLKKMVEDCQNCSSTMRDRILTIVDAAATEPPDTVFDTHKDDNILGYQFLQAIGGPDLVLKAFRYHMEFADTQTLIFRVPWTVIESIGDTGEFKSLIEEQGIAAYWRERGWPERCRPLDGDDFECR